MYDKPLKSPRCYDGPCEIKHLHVNSWVDLHNSLKQGGHGKSAAVI